MASKFRQQIANFSKELPKITDTQISWAKNNCFEHVAHCKKGVTTCLQCGEILENKDNTMDHCVCPQCGAELKIDYSKKRVFRQIKYVCILTTYREFQVLRFIHIMSECKVGQQVCYFWREVVQSWITPTGEHATLALLRKLLCDTWLFDDSNLELRHYNSVYNIMPTHIYPKQEIIPEIKRNGFKGEYHQFTPFDLFRLLLSDHKAETLFKAEKFELLHHVTRMNFDNYWRSIKICLRHNYTITDYSMWFDYIDLLRFFEKDLGSPKYICPDNLKKEHDRMVAKKREYQEQERYEEWRQSILQYNQRMQEAEDCFKKLRSDFFGISFTDGTIQVRVLESVKEFFEEGEAMHNCVYTNEYFLNPDSLILSATVNGKRVETVEVSIHWMKVIQCSGACNEPTKYHDQIIQLVNNNIKKYILKIINYEIRDKTTR